MKVKAKDKNIIEYSIYDSFIEANKLRDIANYYVEVLNWIKDCINKTI